MKIQLLLITLFTSLSISGQSYYDIADSKTGQLDFSVLPVVGLWEVIEVTVGDKELTPTAKWFEIIDGGKLFSGNGGITYIRGSWSFDKNTKLMDQSANGQQDPYGAFEVNFENDQMTWQRLEDGMKVTVILSKVIEKPLGPWDKIQGNWITQKAEGLDPNSKAIKSEYILDQDRYYFGWDGRYRKFNAEGKRIETGIWHIESHSPWLWTISDADNTKTGWSIDLQEKSMTWTKEGDTEILKVYFERAEN